MLKNGKGWRTHIPDGYKTIQIDVVVQFMHPGGIGRGGFKAKLIDNARKSIK